MAKAKKKQNPRDERARHLLDSAFGKLSAECTQEERRTTGIDAEQNALLHELWKSSRAIRSDVMVIHTVVSVPHCVPASGENKGADLVMGFTRGFPVKLCRAREALKKARHLLPQYESPATFCIWSGSSWVELAERIATKHHDILQKHSTKRFPSWHPFLKEAAGQGDGEYLKWRYQFDKASFADLSDALTNIPGMDFNGQAATQLQDHGGSTKKKKRDSPPDRPKREWVIDHLADYHGTPNKPKSNVPLSLPEIKEALEGKVSKATASRAISELFGSHNEYKTACRDETIQAFLEPLAKSIGWIREKAVLLKGEETIDMQSDSVF
jgi:hypothetical protein